MSKHTPAPWGIGISISNLGFVEVRDKDGLGKRIIASVTGNDFTHNAGCATMPPECLANARLIAAAPAMYDECRLALGIYRTLLPGLDGEIGESLRQMIARLEAIVAAVDPEDVLLRKEGA